MTTIQPTAVFVNEIVQSITRRRDRCEAVVVTDSGFVRQPITSEQFDTLSHHLSRYAIGSGPTGISFDIAAQAATRNN